MERPVVMIPHRLRSLPRRRHRLKSDLLLTGALLRMAGDCVPPWGTIVAALYHFLCPMASLMETRTWSGLGTVRCELISNLDQRRTPGRWLVSNPCNRTSLTSECVDQTLLGYEPFPWVAPVTFVASYREKGRLCPTLNPRIRSRLSKTVSKLQIGLCALASKCFL
jgi:hypothetical protein